jgi:tRNA(fMet)-specific endonuclease VapC
MAPAKLEQFQKYMLDTNILIYILKNNPVSVTERLDNLPDSVQLCMSFFSYAELLKGAERSSRKDKALQRIAQITRTIKVEYNAASALCEHYAQQVWRLKEAGTPIGANDLWIACHALAQGCVLVTNNEREFARVQGLKTENWSSV